MLAVESLGAPQVGAAALGLGALVAASGSIAPDLDHPRSFISHNLPSRVLRIALAVLTIPLLAGAATMLTTPDILKSWNQLTALVLGVSVLRWSLAAVGASLALVGLSWLLYKSLHHRGPLHSIFFTILVSSSAALLLAVFKQNWVVGLVFGWGWLWHILADGLTPEGVPFAWPFNDSRKHTLPQWACALGRGLLTFFSIAGILVLLALRLRLWMVG